MVIDFLLGVRQLALGVLEISLGSITAPGFWGLLILERPTSKRKKV
jgi:hypothetical protein